MNGCPSLDQLALLLEERLEISENDSIENHVEDCSSCQASLQRLSSVNSIDLRSKTTHAIESPTWELNSAFLLRLQTLPQAESNQRDDPAVHSGESPSNGAQRLEDESIQWPSVSGFEILSEIGRGGMGVVFKARQVSLNRFIALKMIESQSPLTAKRFRVEAEVVATLDHPHIVPIYEIGMSLDVRPYYAMKLIEGGSLAEWIASRRIAAGSRAGLQNVVQLMAIVARAVHHAHQNGILHRDLKPANILLDEQGQPYVTDFGLAKHVDEDADLTQSGLIMGTPGYMAPEQAMGRTKGLTTADLFSIGAILYELLTGKRPFHARSPMETLLRVIEHDPEPPRRINPLVDADLDTICLKALEKEAGRRYGSAEALAEDLERWLRREPVLARRAAVPERLLRWARRRPVAAALVAVSIAAAAGLLGSTFLLNDQRARAAATRARMEADSRKDLELSYYFRTIALADRERSALNAGAAERMLEQCPEYLRGWEWNLLKRQGRSNQPPPLVHSSHLFSIAASPDGQWIITGGVDGSVTMWDTTQLREPRRRSAHDDQVRGLAFSGDSRLYASAGWDGTVNVWETESGRCLHSWKIGKLAFAVAFGGPDGRQLAASNTTDILRWNLPTGELVDTLDGHRDVVRRLVYSPDGKSLASVDDRGVVKVWNAATGNERLSFQAHPHLIFDIAFNQDGSRFVTAGGQFTMHGDSGEVMLWDTASGAKLREFRTNQGAFYAAAFCPGDRRVVTGGEDGVVRVWDIPSGQETLRLRGHTEAVWALTFRPNSGRLFTASADHSVRVWDGTPIDAIAKPDVITLDDAHRDRVTSVAFSHDGLLLATASMDGTVRLWDALKKLLIRDLPISSGTAQSIAFSPDSRRLALGIWRRWGDETKSGMISILDTQTWEELEKPLIETVGVLGVAYSPSGASFSATADHGAVVWDASTGEKLWSISHSSLMTSVAFSQSDLLALADANGVVTVCAGRSGRVLRELPAHHGRVFSVAFSPDGRLLATAGADGEIHIWSTAQWRQLPSPRGHQGGAYGIAFAPDGRRLASGGNDGAVRVWSTLTGAELGSLSGHTDTIHAVAFGPDGNAIASGGRDKTVRVWNAVPNIKSPSSIENPHKRH